MSLMCADMSTLYLGREGDESVTFIAQACSSFVEVREGLFMKTCELMKYLQVVSHNSDCTTE